MKLQELKVGDQIKHYCAGHLIKGTVVKTGKDYVKTKHVTQVWAGNITDSTIIRKSDPWQHKLYQTTPGAFTLDMERIES